MASPRVVSRSFAGGELTPHMGGRSDDAKYAQGADRLQNWLVLPQGPIQRRPGFGFVREVKDSALGETVQLLPFVHSTGQAFVIEMGAEVLVDGRSIGYFRFHTDGATLLYGEPGDAVSAVNPYAFTSVNTGTDVIDFGGTEHGRQTGDPIQFAGAGVLPAPLVVGRRYYAIRTSAVAFKVALSKILAEQGTAVDLTTTGSGDRWLLFPHPGRNYITPTSVFSQTGTSSATGATSMTDATAPFVAGALVGMHLICGSVTGRITANTTSVLTVGAGWSGATPPAVSSYQIDGVDLVNDSFTMLNDHGMTVGDPVVITIAAPVTLLPTPLLPNTTYYAIVVSARVLQFALTEADALVATEIPLGTMPAGGLGAGLVKVHYAYQAGDLTYWTGVGTGTFYARRPPWDTHTDHPPTDTDYWVREPSDGVYEVPHQYLRAQLFDIQHKQSADVLRLGHRDVGVTELRRYDALRWVLTDIALAPPLSAPTGLAITAFGGNAIQILSANNGTARITLVNPHQLREGDPCRVTGAGDSPGNGGCDLPDGTYIVKYPTVAAGVGPFTELELRQVSGGLTVAVSTKSPLTDAAYVRPVPLAGLIDTNVYVITALDSFGNESQASAEEPEVCNLDVPGSYNDISWAAVTGAVRYRIYKKQTGLFGLIGETEALTFRDDDIGPDLSVTPPRFDSAGGAPGAIGSFEGRFFFGGSDEEPQTIRGTRSNTQSDLSYHLPLQDDDRINFTLSSSQLAHIRHIIDLGHLVLLTSSGEVVVRPRDTDALTPDSITARFESYIGASRVQPVLANNRLVWAADRGGRVHVGGFVEGGRFSADDLSVRAGHLFDGLTIKQFTITRAPHLRVWGVSSTGRLLVLSYLPEEAVVAWSWFDTLGTFESVCAIPDGDEDRVYAIVQHNIEGEIRKYVVRLGPQAPAAIEDGAFVDSGASYDGTNTGNTTLTLTLAVDEVSWLAGTSVTIEASDAIFDAAIPASSPDIGDHLIVTAVDITGHAESVTVEITAVTDANTATGTILTAAAVSLQGVATVVWAWARDTISGFDHLEGVNVAILADGAVPAQQIVTGGTITLVPHATKVHGGLGYRSELRTLPVAAAIDGLGQGRAKNVTQAWVRVQNSGRFRMGPVPVDGSEDPATADLALAREVPAGELFTGEVPISVSGEWQRTGQTLLRMEDPLPLTVIALAMRVNMGDG